MIDLTTTVVSALIIAIACTLVAAAWAFKARNDAYYKGRDDENQVTVEHFEALRSTIAGLRAEADLHQGDIDKLKQQNADEVRKVTAELKSAHRDNTALHQEAERLGRAVALLQSAPPFPEYITLRDITTIEQMAEKLRIAAPALHATQQFAASKEADRLANSAKRLADKLRPALIAAAAPVTPAQDAAA